MEGKATGGLSASSFEQQREMDGWEEDCSLAGSIRWSIITPQLF